MFAKFKNEVIPIKRGLRQINSSRLKKSKSLTDISSEDYFSDDEEMLNSPYYFAQVREDPTVEINAYNNELKNPADILMITSGGDTVLALATKTKCKSITAIDMNIHQNEIARLKMSLLLSKKPIEKIEQILSFGFHEPALLLTELRSNELMSDESFYYWYGKEKYLRYGINRSGRYEILFKKFADHNFDPDWFDTSTLTWVFGGKAVKFSTKKGFDKHFADVMKTYRQKYPDPESNYFYYQIMYGYYPKNLKPPYLTPNTSLNPNKIKFLTDDFVGFLITAKDQSYDMVQTSNITDWMPLETVERLVKDIHRVLRPGGVVVMRRLISDNELKPVVEKLFTIKPGYHDDSEFYTELMIGIKGSNFVE